MRPIAKYDKREFDRFRVPGTANEFKSKRGAPRWKAGVDEMTARLGKPPVWIDFISDDGQLTFASSISGTIQYRILETYLRLGLTDEEWTAVENNEVGEAAWCDFVQQTTDGYLAGTRIEADADGATTIA